MKAPSFHRRRPLVTVALACGAGIGLGVYLPWRPVLWALGLLCAVMTLLLLPRAGRGRAVGCVAAFLFAGALWGGHAAHPVLPPEGVCRVEATAALDLSVREDGKAAGYLENAVLTYEDGRAVKARRLYWTYTPEEEEPFLPREGERVAFSGFLYHPSGRVNPYGSDFRMYLMQQGVYLGVSGASRPEALSAPGRGLASVFFRARKGLEERLLLIFGEDCALPQALLLGVREQIPEETRVGFQKAGAAHILSVSGLHVGLLVWGIMALLRRCCRPAPRLIVLGALLAAYCAMLDFAAPVARASLLVVMYQARHVLRRAPDDLTVLAAAFLVILAVTPLALFSASFILSFCAVLGLCLWGRMFYKLFAFLRFRWLRRGASASLAATIGTLLPTVYFFHQFSLIGLVLNPFLGVLFQFLLPAFAVALLAGCLYLPLGRALAAPLCWAARAVTAGVRAAGNLPLASLRLPSPPWYALVLLLTGLVLLCRFCVLRHKGRYGAACLALSLALWAGAQPRDVRFIQLAVGQSDAAIMTDGAFTTLLDVGGHGGDAAAYLLSTGRQANRVVLTHLHGDHCLGLKQLMEEEIPIGEVFLPVGAEDCILSEDALALMESVRALGIPVRFLGAGDVLETPRTRLTVLWPVPGKTEAGMDANRYSLVSLLEMDGVRVLSMGDLEGYYEKYAMADADVLKVAHHGSKSATSVEFLEKTSPKYAIVTGSDIGSGLPDAETLSRLADAGVLVYNTGKTGAITLRMRNGEGRLTTFLKP